MVARLLKIHQILGVQRPRADWDGVISLAQLSFRVLTRGVAWQSLGEVPLFQERHSLLVSKPYLKWKDPW